MQHRPWLNSEADIALDVLRARYPQSTYSDIIIMLCRTEEDVRDPLVDRAFSLLKLCGLKDPILMGLIRRKIFSPDDTDSYQSMLETYTREHRGQ